MIPTCGHATLVGLRSISTFLVPLVSSLSSIDSLSS